MELRVYTIRLNPPRWLRNVIVYGVFPVGALAGTMTAVQAAASLKTFESGTAVKAADVNANFKTLGDAVAGLQQKPGSVFASAHSTGSVGPNTDWTPIPGLSVTVALGTDSLLQIFGNGVQRTVDKSASTICAGEYRLILDGKPLGDDDGQRIQVSQGSTAWHSIWNLVDSAALDAGQHTISIETRHDDVATAGGRCYACGELDGSAVEHDGCALNVIAIPQ